MTMAMAKVNGNGKNQCQWQKSMTMSMAKVNENGKSQ